MSRLSLAKEFNKLLKTLEINTANQAKITEYNLDDLSQFTVEIRPCGGLYAFGTFYFMISIDPSYPSCGPTVTCQSDIFHPNIESQGSICLNLLDEWTEAFGLEDLIKGILFLFYEPNIESPLSSYFHSGISKSDFINYVKMFLKGENFTLEDRTTEFSPNPGYLSYENSRKELPNSTEVDMQSNLINAPVLHAQENVDSTKSLQLSKEAEESSNTSQLTANESETVGDDTTTSNLFVKEFEDSLFPQLLAGMFVDSIVIEEEESVEIEANEVVDESMLEPSHNIQFHEFYSKYITKHSMFYYFQKFCAYFTSIYKCSNNNPFI